MQLLKTTRYNRLLLTRCCLSLSLLNSVAFARAQDSAEATGKTQKTEKSTSKETTKSEQETADPQKEKDTGESPNAQSSPSSTAPAELPLLLLLVQRPPGTSAHREDANTALSTMLRSSLRESRKYQVILYSAEHPSIRRALLEHSIAATELIEPIKPAAMQKLAFLLGARHILMVSTLLDKVGMKTDIRLMQNLGLDTWVTPRSEPVSVDAQFGKLKLKTDQMVALTVDSIDSYLGIPSHLAANIHLSHTKLIGKAIAAKDAPDSKNKPTVAKNNIDGSAAEKPKEDTTEEASDNTKNTTTTRQMPSKSVRPAQIAKNDKKTGEAATSAQTNPPETNPQETNGNQPANTKPAHTKADVHVAAPRRGGSNQTAILATDAGAFLLSEPKIVPPVPPTDKVNHEALADRYRHVGDLPNSIEALRQAIDEKPRDMHLRKKLVQAYQDRQLFEQAISETERAMLMEPNDADLSRLYANCLAAKGDTAGATKLLQNIVAANPKNTAAQVALGDALLADNMYTDAYRAFEAAAENDPKSPLPHRRLARVMAARAGSDPKQYIGCLQQIEEARRLTPATDTLTYQGDYFALMLMLESRLKDMLDQVNETYIGTGKRPQNGLQRIAADLNLQAEAASDFIDKLQPAVGQDTTHAHFAQGAAFLVQATGYLRKYIKTNDMQIGGSLRGTRLDALSAFSTAHNRLIASRAALEKGRAATGEIVGGN